MSNNPYQTPSTPVSDSTSKHDIVRSKLSRPATALIIMSSIHSVFLSIYVVSHFVLVANGNGIAAPIELAISCAHLTALIVISIGAAKMGFLESLTMAWVGAILACVPLVTPIFVLGIPFGIWAVCLLAKPEVRSAFPRK